MRNMTYRIYGKELNTWEHELENGRVRTYQIEVAYKEYDKDGDLCGVGSEDFSLDRYNVEMMWKFVWTWDGVKRNKGGHRWFECQGMVRYTRKDARAVKEHFKRVYNAELVELR